MTQDQWNQVMSQHSLFLPSIYLTSKGKVFAPQSQRAKPLERQGPRTPEPSIFLLSKGRFSQPRAAKLNLWIGRAPYPEPSIYLTSEGMFFSRQSCWAKPMDRQDPCTPEPSIWPWEAGSSYHRVVKLNLWRGKVLVPLSHPSIWHREAWSPHPKAVELKLWTCRVLVPQSIHIPELEKQGPYTLKTLIQERI